MKSKYNIGDKIVYRGSKYTITSIYANEWGEILYGFDGTNIKGERIKIRNYDEKALVKLQK